MMLDNQERRNNNNDNNGEDVNNNNVWQWFTEIPFVTRTYLVLSVATTMLCSIDYLSPLSLYFNARLIIVDGQYWRLFTNFLFFGLPGLDFVFHMYFLVQYCRLLEDTSFRGRTADFLFLILFGMFAMSLLGPFFNIAFFSHSLSFMMVYIWGRRNEQIRMSFLGLFPFQACYLPWVLLSFSFLLGGGVTQGVMIDGIGIIVGHIYFFADDIFPEVSRIRGWKIREPLRAPRFFKLLVNALTGEGQVYEPVGGLINIPIQEQIPIPDQRENAVVPTTQQQDQNQQISQQNDSASSSTSTTRENESPKPVSDSIRSSERDEQEEEIERRTE